MYDTFIEDKIFINVAYKTKIEKQTLLIELSGYPSADASYINWNVCLVVYTKRKEIDSHFQKSTGNIGLKGLFAAKEILHKFESYLKNNYWRENHNIFIGWDDNRRRNVYERGLRNLGYKFEMGKLDPTDQKEPYKKYLIKHIQKEG